MARTRRRLIGSLGCALALALSASDAAAQETTVLAPTAFNADGGSVTTPALQAGRTYRLVAAGTFQEVGPNITFDHDSAYCFGDNASTPICRGDPSPSQTGLWANYESGSARPFYELAGSTVPAYQSGHIYELFFTAAASEPLRFLANTPEVGRDYPGQLGVALYLQTGTACRRGAVAEASQCNPGTQPEAYSSTPVLGNPSSYLPPPNGQAVNVKGPKLPAQADAVTVIHDSTNDDEFLALKFRARRAKASIELCALASASIALADRRLEPDYVVGTCLRAVLQVLERCQALKTRRGGPGLCGGSSRRVAGASAAGGCNLLVVKLGRKGGQLPVRTKCETTPLGTALTLSRRPGGPSLRKSLGKQPKLVIGTPASAPPVGADDRIDITWLAG